MTSLPIRSPVRILGIDPGLRRTGWGVIDLDGNRLIHVGCGSVESREAQPLAERLRALHEGLARVLADFNPVEAAVEQERLEAWIMTEVDRGVPLPGLYPPNAETKARYEATRK